LKPRWFAVAVFLSGAAFLAIAQDQVPHPTPAEAHEAQAGEHEDFTWTLWKIANFAILATGLGYLFAKKGKPFFQERSHEIQKGIATASAEKQAADARFGEIERRLANLDAEIAALRASAKEEMNAESERIRLETTERLAKIHTQAEQQIVSITKATREALKSSSAALAIELAGRRMRAHMTPELQDRLVAGFTATLPEGGGRN
jgi:F0F1-type ATP synthase membrane subunit b/b'